ncbi:MAG: hypothetical protein RJA66_643 [Actinomycetota bacterium]
MVAAIGVGILLAPMTVIWLVENDPTVDWFVAFRTSADVWMLAQGAHLMFAAGALGSSQVPAFVVSILPLGFSALLAYLSFRLGRRMSGAADLWPGWLGAVLAYGAISFGLSTAAYNPAVYPVTWQGTMLPPIFFFFFLAIGSLTGPLRNGEESRERAALVVWFGNKWNETSWAIRALAIPALRGGTAIVAMLVALSAISFSILLAVNWITVTRLYEGLHVSVLGGFTVTIGELAFLPNLIIFGAAWFTGVGFSIGTGSSISPLGSAVGPMPGIPFLGAIPAGQVGLGLAAVAIPLIAAFVATIAIKKHADEIRFEFASAWSAAISLGLSVGLVAAIEMGILAAVASGSAGPGRLETVGVNPFILAAVVFVETAVVSILAAFFSARPDEADHPMLSER